MSSFSRALPSFPFWRSAPVLVCALLLNACGGGTGAGPLPGAAGTAVPVTTTVVEPRAWNDSIAALGTVNARESVTITAKVSETVQRVNFDSGDRVSAGDVLIILSGNQQQAMLESAEAAAREAEQQYVRGNELVGQQLIARASIDTLRATRDSARADIAQMRANIGDRTIRAPFAGVLGLRQVSPGALVTPGTPIATLDDLSTVYVDFPVPEVRLATITPGQRVFGSSAAYPDADAEGEVQVVDSRVDPNTRAVAVRAAFDNPDNRLRPGMLIQVRLEQRERQALMIPEIAVIQVGRDTFVYRVRDDDTVEQAPVTIGVRGEGLAEIIDGLEPGTRIVVDGTGKLRPGMAVVEGTVQDAKSAPVENADAVEGNAT